MTKLSDLVKRNKPMAPKLVINKPQASAVGEPKVRSSALLEAAESLATISSSGYSEEYERGWNNAVKHNRTKLKAMAGDREAIAQMGWCKASNADIRRAQPDSVQPKP